MRISAKAFITTNVYDENCVKKVIDDEKWSKNAKYPIVIDSSTQGEIADQLETIYTVNLTDKKTGMSTTRTIPLTKEQEKIYKALDLLS